MKTPLCIRIDNKHRKLGGPMQNFEIHPFKLDFPIIFYMILHSMKYISKGHFQKHLWIFGLKMIETNILRIQFNPLCPPIQNID